LSTNAGYSELLILLIDLSIIIFGTSELEKINNKILLVMLGSFNLSAGM